MADLRVEFKFKNAILYGLIKGHFGNAPLMDVSNKIGISYAHLIYLLNLTRSPYLPNDHALKRHKGAEVNGVRYTRTAMKIADFFNIEDPAEIFPVALYSLKLPRNYYKEFASVELLSLQEAAAQKLLPPIEGYEDRSDLAMLKENMAEALQTLTEREQAVIRLRFGFDGPEKTLEEVSAIYNVNRERIRQIECKALRKLRHPAHSNLLKPYHDDIQGVFVVKGGGNET